MSSFQNFVPIVSAVISSLWYVIIIKYCYSFFTETKIEKWLKILGFVCFFFFLVDIDCNFPHWDYRTIPAFSGNLSLFVTSLSRQRWKHSNPVRRQERSRLSPCICRTGDWKNCLSLPLMWLAILMLDFRRQNNGSDFLKPRMYHNSAPYIASCNPQ